MKENENKEQSKTAGAARQGGDTSNESIGSAVSTAVGELVATDVRFIVDVVTAVMDQLGYLSAADEHDTQELCDALAAALAAPTQAKPVDLSGLTRYDSFETDEGDELRVEPTGCWVQFDDVERLLAAPTQVSAPTDELKQLRNRVSQLEAARIGYASEFPMTADGEPDVGNIHANIRALKAQVRAPQADELSISRQKLNMAKIDVLMDGARARSEEFRDGVTFGANSLHMKMLELAGAPQASAAQEVRAVPEGVPSAPLNGIPQTFRHDEGAIAQCFYCRRYSLDPATLSDRQPTCECGKRHGWSGSFKRPGPDAEWSGKAPSAVPTSTSTAPAAIDEGRSPWISIDDQLPELHVTVALLDENRWMNTGSSDHNVNWHGAGYLCEFGHKYWSVFGEMRSQCLDAVTHWMPLPAAPASQASLDEVTGAGKGEA